jgi:hypothetical protein
VTRYLICLALAVAACGAPAAAGTPHATHAPAATAAPASPARLTPPIGSPTADVCHVGGQTYCALNSAVTDGNVHQTICNPAWTKGLRPPTSMTEKWKHEILDAYNLPGTVVVYEGDHRMPEADLGGDPAAYHVNGRWVMTTQTVTLPTGQVVPANFADESPPSPNPKDHDETALHDEVCAGRLSLTAARTQLRDKWLLPYPGYRQ